MAIIPLSIFEKIKSIYVPKEITTVKPGFSVSIINETTEGVLVTSPSYQRRKSVDQTEGRVLRPSSYSSDKWAGDDSGFRSKKIEYFDYIEVFGKEKCNELLGQDLLHITVFSLSGKMIPFHFGESFKNKDFPYNSYQMIYVCFGPSKEESKRLSEIGEIPFIPFARFYCLRNGVQIKDNIIHEIASAFTFSGKEVTYEEFQGAGNTVRTKTFNPSNKISYCIEQYCDLDVFNSPNATIDDINLNGDLLDKIKGGRKKLIDIVILEELEIQEADNKAYRKRQKEIAEKKSKKDNEFMDKTLTDSLEEAMTEERIQKQARILLEEKLAIREKHKNPPFNWDIEAEILSPPS